MNLFKRFICLTLLLAAGACSAWPEVWVGAGANPDWRVAHVDRVLTAREHPAVVGATQDCRAVVSDRATEQTWLLVHFRRPPIMVFRVVPAIGNHEYGLGDQIMVNVSDCRVPAHVSPVSSKVDLI